MTFEFSIRNIPTIFLKLGDKEFPIYDVVRVLGELLDTEANDRYGEYSLRDYELSHKGVADELAKLGYVKNYTGSRMANLYCKKDEKLFDDFYNEVLEKWEEFEKENKANE